MPEGDETPFRDLPSTHWSLIRQVCESDPVAARRALAELLRRYLPALRSYLVLQKRLPADRADDLIQGFLASEVLDGQLIRRADPGRGKFRGLLITALDRYALRDLRRSRARKREPDRAVSLDEAGTASAEWARRPPSDVFDVAWARRVIDQALDAMRTECDGAGRSDLWLVFEGRILSPTLDGADPVPYEELVSRFGLQSPKQAANAVITARRMFTRHLREVVAQYVLDPSDIDREISDLQQTLSRNSSAPLRSR